MDLGLAHSAQSTDPSSPGLEELWEEYPLEAPETVPGPSARSNDEPTSPPAPRASDDADTSTRWLVLGAGIGAVAAILTAAVVTRRRRRGPVTAVQPELPDELIARAHALATEAAECDKYLHGQRHEGISVMTGTHDHDLSDAAPEPQSRAASSSYADIGERVAGVLAAAETASTQIRDDARASAEEILSLAREEAETLRQEASAYDADTRAAVESYAADRRREVDQEVQRQLADSETQARATRQAAEAMARQIEEEARRRGQALRDESRTVEERLKKAAQGLRRMTAEIEELLGAPAGDGESLTDALRPYSQQPDLPVTAAPTDER